MNRYVLLDLEKNTIYNINKVNIDFEENEKQASSTTCIDKDDLYNFGIEWLQELKEIEEKKELKK